MHHQGFFKAYDEEKMKTNNNGYPNMPLMSNYRNTKIQLLSGFPNTPLECKLLIQWLPDHRKENITRWTETKPGVASAAGE